MGTIIASSTATGFAKFNSNINENAIVTNNKLKIIIETVKIVSTLGRFEVFFFGFLTYVAIITTGKTVKSSIEETIINGEKSIKFLYTKLTTKNSNITIK